MKKLLLFVCLLTAVLMSGSCDNRVYFWDFEHDYQDIKEIRIVEVDQIFDYTEVKTLDLSLAKDLFYEIESFPAGKYGWNLGSPYGRCFIIVFSDHEYDLISAREPKHCRYEDGMWQAYNSYLEYDDEEFQALIDKYLNQ